MTWPLQEHLVLTPSWLFADNSCSPLAFTCARGGQCIPSQWRCDQHNDCLDGSDEQNCPTRPTSTCPSTSFTCDNHLCIPRDWVCDTDNDCSDGSDERNCGEFWAACSGSLSLEWFEQPIGFGFFPLRPYLCLIQAGWVFYRDWILSKHNTCVWHPDTQTSLNQMW